MLPALPTLLLALVSVMVLDLLTGIIKAKLNNVIRTSKAMRRSVIKFIQYFTAIALAVGLQWMLKDLDESTKENISYITRGLIVFIVFIEIFSCCENVYEVDKTSKFSVYVITPILKILSFGFKNNPLSKEADKLEKTENEIK